MNTQNQIKRTLSEPAAIEDVRQLLAGNEFPNRTQAAAFICQRFGFSDARGHPQLGGCLKALRELEAAGHWRLPAARNTPGRRSPRRLSEPLAPLREVPTQAGQVRGLALVVVDTSEHMRIWNELMITEHPRGAGPLVGRQLRYLIASEHGWLGGLGFAAPALQLAERDRWIGWDVDQRRAYLHTVVGMSRFLIRPSVQCHNLASKMLSLSLAQLPGDFQQQYGYAPWLVESFVDAERYDGACYRAANWIWVGRTQGRGRQDRFRHASESVKDIYLYPLRSDFRARMGLPTDAGRGALGLAAGLENDTWAAHEFGGAPLGDVRLSKRVVSVAAAQAEQPGRAFCGVAKADWAAVKGYYRLIDRPQASAVTMTNLLAPHRERTVRRMKGHKTVLCIQDGSDLDYHHLSTCEGLGVIGSNQTDAQTRGLHLHSTLALTPSGLPLGVVQAQCVAPKPKSPQDDRPTFAIPIEEKKTFCWIEHHRDLVELSVAMPHTRLIDVCDREADFFELFDEQRRTGCVELLVRAKYNRHLTEDPFQLFPAVRQAPVQSRVRVVVPRQSARPKRSKQKARRKRPARTVTLAVRYTQVQLRPAHYHKDKAAMDLWVIHALEEDPPAHSDPVEWFLLTTLRLGSAADAEQCLRWYCLRWRIEDWHRVLKSGCRIEAFGHGSAERLRRAIAINLVIAWRIMLLTLLGRETPQLPAEVLFSDIELRTLSAYAKKKACRPPRSWGRQCNSSRGSEATSREPRIRLRDTN